MHYDVQVKSIRTTKYSGITILKILEYLGIVALLVKDIIPLIKMLIIIIRGVNQSRENFISSVLKFRYHKLHVGDCIVSSFFRDPRTPVLPRLSAKFILYIILCFPRLRYQRSHLQKVLKNYDTDTSLFFCFETTGFDEIARRYIVDKGYRELKYSRFHQGYRIYKGYSGVDIRRSVEAKNYLYDILSDEEISIGKKTINNLVKRKAQYPYLQALDINTSIKLDINKKEPKKTIILFLSSFSDAQYLYGESPFGDLHGFQNCIIKWGLSLGLNVVVKAHPGMFADKETNVKDRKYYELLRKSWSVRKHTKYVERSTRNCDLYFVDSKMSVKELSKVFPDFLCATQHGSVAAECAVMGHLAVVGTNSQYFSKDEFVIRVKDTAELSRTFIKWQKHFEGYNDDELESIYKYVYLYNVKCLKLYASRIFHKHIPKDVEPSDHVNWIENFLRHDSGVLRQKLIDEAVNFTKRLNNDFHNVIIHER